MLKKSRYGIRKPYLRKDMLQMIEEAMNVFYRRESYRMDEYTRERWKQTMTRLGLIAK